MRRRQFGREFKIEAVRLIKDRGVSVTQASRDLDVHENQLRKWVKLFSVDPAQAFPGHGQMKSEQLEIEKLRREVAKLKAEHDILKQAAAREAVAKASIATIPAGRYGKPQEFADVVTFLASERASYVTGAKIRIDGGLIRGI